MTDTGPLLAGLALLICAPLVACAYWLYLDAKDRADIRRHDAEMADAAARLHKRHQHDDRHMHDNPERPE
jgi:hypothetical protein